LFVVTLASFDGLIAIVLGDVVWKLVSTWFFIVGVDRSLSGVHRRFSIMVAHGSHLFHEHLRAGNSLLITLFEHEAPMSWITASRFGNITAMLVRFLISSLISFSGLVLRNLVRRLS
jgi:hypothetical protein